MWLYRRNIWAAIRASLFLGITTLASELAWGQSTVSTFGPDVPLADQPTIRYAFPIGQRFGTPLVTALRKKLHAVHTEFGGCVNRSAMAAGNRHGRSEKWHGNKSLNVRITIARQAQVPLIDLVIS